MEQHYPSAMDLSPTESMAFPRCARGDRPLNNTVGGPTCGCNGHLAAPCGGGQWCMGGAPLAMVYAPCQAFRDLYDLDTALTHGTLFAELNLPLEASNDHNGRRGCGCGEQRRG